MKLEEVVADVTTQLNDQAALGVSVHEEKDIPEVGPANGGIWARIPNATAVFADLKRSTLLSVAGSRTDAAYAYTYFIRAMTVILNRFSARYVDIQGDAVFGLFSGGGLDLFRGGLCRHVKDADEAAGRAQVLGRHVLQTGSESWNRS